MTFSLLCIVCLAFFMAGLTQTMAGFGSALVAVPLLTCVLPMRVAVPTVCLLNLALNVLLAFKLREHIQWRLLARLFPASVPGMLLGTWGLGSLPSEKLEAVLGLLILAIVWWQCRPKECPRPVGMRLGLLAGFLSGLCGALFGANGPPVVAWMACQHFPRDIVRGTLTTFFFLVGLTVVTGQVLGGMVTIRVLGLAAVGLPSLLIGMAAGMAGVGHISECGFRRLLLGLLAATGLSLLVQFGLAWI